MNKDTTLLLVLELANSKKPKRPSGERSARIADPLENRERLIEYLLRLNHPYIPYDRLDSLAVDIDEIAGIRDALDQLMMNILAAKEILTGAIVTLNESAKNCCWVRQLRADGTYTEAIQTSTLAGMIASICILELSQCDITRVKVCEQAPCNLYFYDTTRNRSARWHAENPCGWRARSDRRK